MLRSLVGSEMCIRDGKLVCIPGNAGTQKIAENINEDIADFEKVYKIIKKKNILYVPDFLINAGGIISVYHEQINDLDPKKVMEMTESIYGKVEQVLSYAEENSLSTHSAAINLAQQRITQNSKK